MTNCLKSQWLKTNLTWLQTLVMIRHPKLTCDRIPAQLPAAHGVLSLGHTVPYHTDLHEQLSLTRASGKKDTGEKKGRPGAVSMTEGTVCFMSASQSISGVTPSCHITVAGGHLDSCYGRGVENKDWLSPLTPYLSVYAARFQLSRKEDKLGPHTRGLGHLMYSVAFSSDTT